MFDAFTYVLAHVLSHRVPVEDVVEYDLIGYGCEIVKKFSQEMFSRIFLIPRRCSCGETSCLFNVFHGPCYCLISCTIHTWVTMQLATTNFDVHPTSF